MNEKIELNRVVFVQMLYKCPCCNDETNQEKFIVNGCPDGRVLVTFECRKCFKLVQVFAAGESQMNGGNYAKAL